VPAPAGNKGDIMKDKYVSIIAEIVPPSKYSNQAPKQRLEII
jgi:hypothetical protein